jgi:nicotinate-nucleotide pyrophosphorylase (carboxylating)
MGIQPGIAECENLRRLLAPAVAEDLGGGDVTAALLPDGLRVEGRFVAREELVFCGGALLAEIAAAYDEGIVTQPAAGDGEPVSPGAPLASWAGPARSILSAERVALNFVQRLSGIATLTRRYVDAVAGTGAAILDTRKTTPGWRALEKYAVRAGGGQNHRMGLYDAVLIKDNHLGALAADGRRDPIGVLGERLAAARDRLANCAFVEIEVDTLEQLDRALTLPVDVVLLDNMAPAMLREAVRRRDEAGLRGRVRLEASGGVTLENVRAVAEAGVEQISIGALTHSAPAVDVALEIALG